MAPRIYEHWGLDGGKYLNLSNSLVLADSGERIWAACVHAANGYKSLVAYFLQLLWWSRRLRNVLTDQAYFRHFTLHLPQLDLDHQLASKPF